MTHKNELDPRQNSYWLPEFSRDQKITSTVWYKKLRTKVARQRVKQMLSPEGIQRLIDELAKFK